MTRLCRRILNQPFVVLKMKNSFSSRNFPSVLQKLQQPFIPNTVIVRFSDFKTNEYRNLVGGEHFEPLEENPMIGWRGASRYYSDVLPRSIWPGM